MLSLVHRQVKLPIRKSQPHLGYWATVVYVKALCWVGQAQSPAEVTNCQMSQHVSDFALEIPAAVELQGRPITL